MGAVPMKFLRYLFVSCLLMFACSGCVKFSQYTGLNFDPQQPDPGMASVYVYQLSPNLLGVPISHARGYHRNAWELALDGRYKGVLKPNTFLHLDVRPGMRTFTIKLDKYNRVAGSDTQVSRLTLRLAAGDLIFIKLNAQADSLQAKSTLPFKQSLVQMPNDRALDDLHNFQLTHAGYVSASP